jgi:hypothetical protein
LERKQAEFGELTRKKIHWIYFSQTGMAAGIDVSFAEDRVNFGLFPLLSDDRLSVVSE